MVDFRKLLAESRAKQEQEKAQPQQTNPLIQLTETAEKSNPFAALAQKVATNSKPVEELNPEPDSTLITNPIEIEKKSAEEFHSDDQPDNFNEQITTELKNSVEILKESFENRELVSEALKNIMLLLRKHDFLKDMLLPEDCGAMVKALRLSYGKVITIKNTRTAKAAKIKKDVADVMADLDGLDIKI